jgi:signal transduction histidine kinase
MSERKRLFLLISIMATAALIVAGVTIAMLYRAAFSQQEARLVETAQSQARLIEAIARFDKIHQKKWHPHVGVPAEATLRQIMDAHKHYEGFGETGEFTLARRDGDNIMFLLSHRHGGLDRPKPITLPSDLSEPMQQALSGKSGTLVGHDYRGAIVLAAHEPIKELNYGIVAKIDLAEVRAPFVRAGVIALGFMVLVVLAGAMSFLRITKPMIKRLENQADELKKAHDKLEERVEERTKELSRANTLLTQEITERKKTGEALKQSEKELRRLSSKLLTAHEEESKRIGQELHDGLAQTLSAVKIWVENAIIQLGQKDSVEAAKSLESVVPLTRGAVEEVRRISRNLRPSSLDDLGVLATISSSCHEFRTLYPKIEMEEQIEIGEGQVPDSLKIVIYRVLQEALNNIAKHSGAKLVRISLKLTAGMIEMIIDDNGEGFEMEYILTDQRSDRGLGIASMKERTELSGGSFLIESGKGVGTTVRASWSLT